MAADADYYDYYFKIVLIGDSRCGKSSLLLRYTDDYFSDPYLATIGVDFKSRTLQIDDKTCKLQLWDTAGQERFRTIISSYYKINQGIIIVFDVLDSQSFVNAQKWLEEVKSYISTTPTVLVVGNKVDLAETQPRGVTYEAASEWASKNGFNYIETSAKSGLNVTEAFHKLTLEMIHTVHFVK